MAIADLAKIEAMMQFVVQHDPAYFYGGAHFFLGTLYGTRPKMLGGDSAISRKHFEDCLALNGGKEGMDVIARFCREVKTKLTPGGYVLMAGCDVPPQAPPVNVFQLVKAAREFGRY